MSSDENRTWTDREGTRWTVTREPSVTGLAPRLAFRSEEYAFVVILPEGSPREPAENEYQGLLDREMGRSDIGHPTARLWTDSRSGIEWEVRAGGGELVFRNGTEVVRVQQGDERPPRDLDDEDLQEILDRGLGVAG